MGRTVAAMTAMIAICTHCKAAISSDRAQCPECRQWVLAAPTSAAKRFRPLSSVEDSIVPVVRTGPWDPIFGPAKDAPLEKCGFPAEGIVMLGGNPGGGKSTLAIQIAGSFVKNVGAPVLYISKEEGDGAIAARGRRVRLSKRARDAIVLTDLSPEELAQESHTKGFAYSLIIVDSLARWAGPGDAGVAALATLNDIRKRTKTPSLVIQHINKEFDFAGLMAYQHDVDVLLTIRTVDGSADDGEELRLIEAHKNRFAQANFQLLLAMTARGLVSGEDDDRAGKLLGTEPKPKKAPRSS